MRRPQPVEGSRGGTSASRVSVYGRVPSRRLEANAFSWVIDGQLAACVDPTAGQQAAAELRRGGVRLLINLHEKPDSADLLAQLGARTLHFPVIGSYAPTQAQLDAGVAAIHDSLDRGRAGCGALRGRAGAHGHAPGGVPGQRRPGADEAMAKVRALRPGSIETLEQEQAIYEYAKPAARAGSAGRSAHSAATSPRWGEPTQRTTR